jgi:hypothetical protein
MSDPIEQSGVGNSSQSNAQRLPNGNTLICEAKRDPTPSNRRLLLVPRVKVTRLQYNGTNITGIELQAGGQTRTISTARELKPNVRVVIAASTVESTRLAQLSFPADGMGANLMAHLRSNTTVRIPRSELGLGAPTTLETGMLLVRGDVPVSGGKTHHFHLQVVAASNLNSAPDSQVFTQIPDIDLRDDVIKAQSPTTIGLVLRAVGELSGDRSMTPVEGPKDTSKSWIDLTKDPNNLEFGSGPTPFDGDNQAGVQAFNSANADPLPLP